VSGDIGKNDYALAINQFNLARIQEPDCTDHEKLVIAVTIVRSGAAIITAAKATGVSVHKIYQFLAEKMPRDAKEEMLEELALDITIQASLAIQERMEAPNGIKSSELVKAMQVSRDTVARKRRWDKDPEVIEEKKKSRLEELLEQVAGKVLPATIITEEDDE
jgi:DNA-binding transcriptional MerR regulator